MTPLRTSRRFLHLALFMGVLGFWALVQQSWVPAAAMVPLAGVMLFALLEVLLPLPNGGRRRIELGDRLLAGDETDVDVVTDRVPFPQNVVLRDAVPEGLDVQPGSQEPFRPHPEGMVARYRVRARRRGDHVFGAAAVARESMFGLFERTATLPTQGQVTVLPASAKFLGVRVRPRPPRPVGMTTRQFRRAPGDEFHSLREYHPGDNLGDVNWKATARMQKIITNEYLPEEPPRYIVYVDTRASGAEIGESDVFERNLELASILIEGLLESRAHVGLVLLSFHSLFIVPSGGPKQRRRLQQMLLLAQPGQEAPLHQLILAGTAHLPARADAILITANVYDPTLGQAVTHLRARHGRVALLAPGFPEPALESAGARRAGGASSLGAGDDLDGSAQRASGAMLNVEQAAALAGIRPLADAATQWPPGEPIAVTLSRLNLTGRMR